MWKIINELIKYRVFVLSNDDIIAISSGGSSGGCGDIPMV